MLREFGSTSRTLRGQLLRDAPSAPPPPPDSAAAASRLWLQGCLEQVYPGHLVCVFDPAAAEDEQQSAWHIVSASREPYDPGAAPQVSMRSTRACMHMSTHTGHMHRGMELLLALSQVMARTASEVTAELSRLPSPPSAPPRDLARLLSRLPA